MREEGTPGVRLHRLLVRTLLPPGFRREHGRDIERVFVEVRREARRAGGSGAARRALRREVGALVALASREWRAALAHRPGRLDTGGGGGMEALAREVRHAARLLVRKPGFTLVAVATLGLGIGAATAIFSVVEGVLLDTLPYDDPDEVVLVGETDPRGGYDALSWENFRDWQRLAGFFDEVALVVGNSVAVSGDGEPERIRGMFVSASYFPLSGVEPALGRAIRPGEDVPDGPRAAVLSHGFWQRRFGGDPGVLGRTVVLNNEPHTVVGVMPADYREVWDTPEALISLHTAPRTFDRAARQFSAMARLADGVGVDRAGRELDALAERLAATHPETNGERGAWVTPMGPFFAQGSRTLLLSLLAAVGTLLLIACTNVASLQLARAGGRVRELALRSALGGSRSRLAGQMLAESLLLSAVGGVVGVLLARAGVAGLVSLDPSLSRYWDVGIDGGVLAFGVGLVLATGVLLGLVPAWWAARTDVVSAMRRGGRGSSDGPGVGRLRSAMVVAQVTLAVALLVSAGLLTGATRRLLVQDMGFERDDLLTLEFRLPENAYASDEAVVAFLDRTLEGIRALPGVEGAATADALPFADGPDRAPFLLEGQGLEDMERAPRMEMTYVSPSYFDVMGIPVLAGRPLEPSDRAETPLVAVLSRTAARRLLDGDEPLGRRFYVTEELDVATVVGVVDDVRRRTGAEPGPLVYLSVLQLPSRFNSVAVRTAGDPMALAPAVRETVWSVDPDQPVWEVMPIEDRIRSDLGRERFATTLFTAFAGMALFLSALGLYGVLAQSVVQRRREIGVRLALGAEARRIVALVVGDGMRLTAMGLVLGVGLAAVVARFLAAAVVGLDPFAATPYLGAVAVLAVVASLAAWLPARRAAALAPVETLAET